MISRSTRDGKQVLIGLTMTEIKKLLKKKDLCAHVRHNDMDISVFIVDGDEKTLEEEFLRIATLSSQGAKPK